MHSQRFILCPCVLHIDALPLKWLSNAQKMALGLMLSKNTYITKVVLEVKDSYLRLTVTLVYVYKVEVKWFMWL